MKCPYCNEKIDNSVSICPACSENITFFAKLKALFIENKRKIITSSAILLGLVLFIFIGTNFYNGLMSDIDNPVYKSISEQEQPDVTDSRMTALEAINLINQQSEDMTQLLKSNALKRRKSAVFNTYMRNLKYYVSIISFRLNNAQNSGIKFNSDPKHFSIVSPQAPYITTSYNEEWGYIDVEVNIPYIDDTFSKHLDKSWRQYLTLKRSEFEETFNNSYWLDNDKKPTLRTIFDWIISWDKFYKEYPDFDTRLISENGTIPLVDTVFRRSCSEYGLSTAEIKKEYDRYLSKADKETDAYKYIKQAYDIFEKHNWIREKFNNDIYDFLSENDFGGWGD